jgi:hypothetical protein
VTSLLSAGSGSSVLEDFQSSRWDEAISSCLQALRAWLRSCWTLSNVDAEQHHQIVQHVSIFRSSFAARFGSMKIALVLPAAYGSVRSAPAAIFNSDTQATNSLKAKIWHA